MHQDADVHSRLRLLARNISESRHPVFFTGAGISTASGLSDYRGPDGVWTRREKGLPPIRNAVPLHQAAPNAGHAALVELQRLGKLAFLITQNVDNLHLRSGIEPDRLAELHGNGAKLRCQRCERKVDRSFGLTLCQCGGRFVDSVVHFGQALPQRELRRSFDHAQRSDLFVVLGSSLTVTPAADLPLAAYRSGSYLVIVNQQQTPLDSLARLRFAEPINEVLPAVVKRVKGLMGRSD